MEKNLKISAAPHVRHKNSTTSIMLDVIIALIPAAAFGIYYFGINAYFVIMTCIISSVVFEALFQYMVKRKNTILDLSAVVTGLLLALNLPPDIPIWMAILGSFFAIIVVKQLFGGLGQNFMNPALGARCFLLLSFTRAMTNFTVDGISQATPLAILKSGGNVSVMDMFIGFIPGTIGETSAIAILIGGLYLLLKKVISIRIPITYIGTFSFLILIYGFAKGYNVDTFTFLGAHICGGGLMLGAFFMATDYVTSPITKKGKLIFGMSLGFTTFILRIYGGSAEGVSYAIIFMNLLVPLIERVSKPIPFGYSKSKEQENDNNKFGIIKNTVSIALITLVFGLAIGAVFNITKDPIKQAKIDRKADAYNQIFPNTSISVSDEYNLEEINLLLEKNGYKESTISEVNLVTSSDDNQEIGYILVITTSNGYSGNIEMAIGIKKNFEIVGISMLTINETVGLGLNAKEEKFLSQYYNKQVSKFEYTKTSAIADNQIDALSGATITTNAVTENVNAALFIVDYFETEDNTEGGAINE